MTKTQQQEQAQSSNLLPGEVSTNNFAIDELIVVGGPPAKAKAKAKAKVMA